MFIVAFEPLGLVNLTQFITDLNELIYTISIQKNAVQVTPEEFFENFKQKPVWEKIEQT